MSEFPLIPPQLERRRGDTSPAGFGRKFANLLQDEIMDVYIGQEEGAS